MNLKVTILALLATLSHAKNDIYELALSDENLFSACPDAAPGTLDVNGFMDLSEFFTSLEENGMLISGNMTFVWDIQPQDRVKMTVNLLYSDRGTWKPTMYSLTSHNFCNSMYDSRQPWYSTWSGHVSNVEDVRDKCVYRGTKLIMETYLMNAVFQSNTLRDGLYKVRFTFRAFDFDDTERPIKICVDLLGNLQKQRSL